MKKTFYILAKDRHVDDVVYFFEGTFEEAKKSAGKILDEMGDYFQDLHDGYGDEYWHASMMEGDYSVTVGIPESLDK